MERTFIKQITPELSLFSYNEIPVVTLQHAVGTAEIALQGAHLLSWQPTGAQQDIFWLSEIEPFKAGTAIRGGIPICYPWFNNAGTPAHGYARINLWQLSNYAISDEKVRLEFSLFSEQGVIIAKITMSFDTEFEALFTNYAEENAQVALHRYFNLGDITQTTLHNLPTTCFNALTRQQETVPSTRMINENVDCVYPAEQTITQIQDKAFQRQIEVEHINASDIVVWNPWHKPTGNMSELGYKTMVCVETSRINRRLALGESLSLKVRLK